MAIIQAIKTLPLATPFAAPGVQELDLKLVFVSLIWMVSKSIVEVVESFLEGVTT